MWRPPNFSIHLKSVDQQPRGAEDLVEENPRPAAAIGRIDVATVFFFEATRSCSCAEPKALKDIFFLESPARRMLRIFVFDIYIYIMRHIYGVILSTVN